MKDNDFFPLYGQHRSLGGMRSELSGQDIKVISIRLDHVEFLSLSKFSEKSKGKLNIRLIKQIFEVEGDIFFESFSKDERKYHYSIKLHFSDREKFLKWIAFQKSLFKIIYGDS